MSLRARSMACVSSLADIHSSRRRRAGQDLVGASERGATPVVVEPYQRRARAFASPRRHVLRRSTGARSTGTSRVARRLSQSSRPARTFRWRSGLLLVSAKATGRSNSKAPVCVVLPIRRPPSKVGSVYPPGSRTPRRQGATC